MISAFPKDASIHFIGIAGIGMSGLAEILLSLGYKVSGSDLSTTDITKKLQEKGAIIYQGHKGEQVEAADVIVYSSAIAATNPEWQRSVERGLPRVRRGELLAHILNERKGLAIAGSHGKTTTSSLVASVFVAAEKDPTFIIGGHIHHLSGNARLGKSELLIAEADESDGSFLFLRPQLIALTNIDDDHLDYYGSRSKIVEAFQEFVDSLPSYGKAILNADDPGCSLLHKRNDSSWLTYGLGSADYQASDIRLSGSGSSFIVSFQGDLLGEFKTHLLGQHNISNALAAIALSHQAGLTPDEIKRGLLTFRGVGRRLEKICEKKSLLVIDDYGHHPTEIRATISALKEVDPRPLCVVFEPHRYTRTQNFWNDFKNAFISADEVYITPIYAASEAAIESITSQRLCAEMQELGINVHYLEHLDKMQDVLLSKKESSVIFLTLGAGAISKRIREMAGSL